MRFVKNCCILLVCLITVVGMWGTVQAAEEGASPLGNWGIFTNHFDKDWGVSIGTKMWVNQWDMPLEKFVGTDEDQDYHTCILEFESDTETSFIPVAMVRYRNFFIGGSYLSSSEYSFTPQELQKGNRIYSA
jgi:hypothetical protein